MVVHFICRGNAFRSLIAEAYIKSLEINDINVHSSGTVAKIYKEDNKIVFEKTLKLLQKHNIAKFSKNTYGNQLTQDLINDNDITVCVNQVVFDEAKMLVTLPSNTLVWDVTDLGENGRIPKNEKESEMYMEEAYQEIVKNVDHLVKNELQP